MAEAVAGTYTDEVDDGQKDQTHGISDQVIDPWCEPCLEETKVKVVAAGYCPECNKHLCLSCQESHRKWLQNHRLLRGSRMPRLHADKPIKYPSCVLHIGNLTDHYCLNHSVMVCNHCIQKDHHECEALPIPDVCKKLIFDDVRQFKSVVTDIKQNVKITQASLQMNISDIESQRKDIMQRAALERDKLISKAKDMFNETVSNINETCTFTTSEIAEQINTLSDEEHQLDQIIDTIDKKTIAEIDANMFVQIQNIVTSTKECKQEIEDTIQQLQITELRFVLNDELTRSKLGTIKEILKPLDTMKDVPNIAFPQPKEKKLKGAIDISQICAKKISFFNVKTADDKKKCIINDMGLTSKGILLIADKPNKKVKFFAEDSKLLTTFDMSVEIIGIAVIDDSEVVISTTDNKLHVLAISALPVTKIQKSISLSYTAMKLTSCSGNIVLACQGTDPASLTMIDRNGKEIWSLTTGPDNQQLFEKPYGVQITTFNGTKVVMVTDWKKQTLTVVDVSNGAVLKIIDLKDKHPLGLTLDDHGNNLICAWNTREILVLSNDLSQSQVLLKGQDIQKRPINILYLKSTGELYVTYNNNDEIDRFQLSVAK